MNTFHPKYRFTVTRTGIVTVFSLIFYQSHILKFGHSLSDILMVRCISYINTFILRHLLLLVLCLYNKMTEKGIVLILYCPGNSDYVPEL